MNRESKKTVYIVYANTYTGVWGCEISLFGICSEREIAEKMVEKLNKTKGNLYYEIAETEVDECSEVYLGGYIE